MFTPSQESPQLKRVLDTLFNLNEHGQNINNKIDHKHGLNLNCNLLKLSVGKTLKVSAEPASRLSVLSLRHQLNSSLTEHQAKPFGLCSMRCEIYDQCFDELLRQITINCVEQGLLLFRVRNELKSRISCYRKLYQSAISYGMLKAIECNLSKEESQIKIQNLEKSVLKQKNTLIKAQRELDIKNLNEKDLQKKLDSYYKQEIAKRDEIIEKQKLLIGTLTKCFESNNEL